MGINYNFLLYYPKEQLWDVLTGLSAVCDTAGAPPTTIRFPDHDLILPLTVFWDREGEVSWDQAKYEFAITMFFDEDRAILDYLAGRMAVLQDRSPSEDGAPQRHAIGLIYLTVYADLSKHYGFDQPNDLALFEFGTTGTQMSLLFANSTSIRSTFIRLLANHAGLCGIFDWEEDYGELFWFRGKEMNFSLSSNYLLPEEIERELERGW